MIDSYISIDLETTGLNPKRDKIIEIGAVKVINGIEQGTFSSLVNPGRKLEQRISELTGIRDEMLLNAPGIDEVFPKLQEFLEDLPLLGHNIIFDYSFLKKAALDLKIEFEKEGIDTLKLARRYLTALEHKNLEYVCGYYGIAYRAHRALGDAYAARELYERICREFCAGKADIVASGLYFNVKRDVPATRVQKERLCRLLEQHKIEIDVSVDKMTRSEADRMIDRILSNRPCKST